ncbi:MAG: LemA family protein [Pseudolabrys sp.]|nr:LemA family protein [Pseudolabrys sp.]
MSNWIAPLIAAALGLYIAIAFNRLVRARQMAREGWSGIDVQLKRRSDLVLNLVDSVKGYAAHERDVLAEVTQLRGAARALPTDAIGQRAAAEGALTLALNKLIALSEAYPDLKASGNFLKLQQQLSDMENELQMARRYYNGAARNLNILVESFPSNLIARPFGFRNADFFELNNAADRAVPAVAL